MPVVEDSLWKNPGNPGMIVVSAHASISEDGFLYMKYGEAAEAARRIPDLERECGQVVAQNAQGGVFGFLAVRPARPEDRLIGFGLFQTRYNWNEGADPDLIRYSMSCLRMYMEDNPGLKIRMNFPGIGRGGMPVEEVSPLLIPLPDQVTICHKGELQRSIPDSFIGFKTIYLFVEELVKEGRHNQAVEYMVSQGFDLQSAIEQVNAVQRILREGNNREVRKPSQYSLL